MSRASCLADFFAGRNIPAVSIIIAPPRQATKSIATTGRPGYVGVYSVLTATDYAACLRAVGDKVEVIGRIVDVKQGMAHDGKPYVFINFGPWRGSIFKVSIWSDGLSHVKVKPDASWVGKWMSVVGLMEPPYVNKKLHYSHLAITVGAAGQMNVISQQEAEWRLAGAGKAAGAFAAATSLNQQTLDRIKSVSGATPPLSNTRSAPPAVSPNSAVLQKIRTASSLSRPAPPPPSPTVRYTYQQKPPGIVQRLFKLLFG